MIALVRWYRRWLHATLALTAAGAAAVWVADWRALAVAVPASWSLHLGGWNPERKRQTYRIGHRFDTHVQGAQNTGAPVEYGKPSAWFASPYVLAWQRTPNDLGAALWYRLGWRLCSWWYRANPEPPPGSPANGPSVEVLELEVETAHNTDPAKWMAMAGTLKNDYRAKALTIEDHDNARFVVTVVWRDRLLEDRPFRMPHHPTPAALLLGGDRHDRDVYLDLRSSHAMIGGATDMGKSSILHALIAQLHAAGVRQVHCDGKGGVELGIWQGIVAVTAKRPDAISATLARMAAELAEREQLMESLGIRTWAKAPQQLPYTVVVLDEVASIFADSDDSDADQAAVQRLVQKGRSAGISLIFSTQHPKAEVLPTAVTANIRHRIGLRCESAHQSDAVMGTGMRGEGIQLHKLPELPGRAIYKNATRWVHLRCAGLYGDQLDHQAAALRQPVAALPMPQPALALAAAHHPLGTPPAPHPPSDSLGIRRADLLARLQAAGPSGVRSSDHMAKWGISKGASRDDHIACGATSNGARWFLRSE